MKVVLLSGGVDSAYLLTTVAEPAIALFVNYGQPSVIWEHRSAIALARHFGFGLVDVRISGLKLGQMERGDGACIVPARNLALISVAANHAAAGNGPGEVWIGCAPQDHLEYPDCREPFLDLVDSSLHLGSEVRLRRSKATRDERLDALGTAAEMCWSCYGSGPEQCGECASCRQ